MILSDSEIKKAIKKGEINIINPETWETDIAKMGSASVDFRLWNSFKYYKRKTQIAIDTKVWIDSDMVWESTLEDWEPFVLHPGSFILWITKEKLIIWDKHCAKCEWRSSLWRLWVIVHSTAGFIDAGFEGQITLEITNINEVPVIIYPWMRFWQFIFEELKWKAENVYNWKYKNQTSAWESKIDLDE